VWTRTFGDLGECDKIALSYIQKKSKGFEVASARYTNSVFSDRQPRAHVGALTGAAAAAVTVVQVARGSRQ
jgi:hypothetical protein